MKPKVMLWVLVTMTLSILLFNSTWADESVLIWSTYLGGTENDSGLAITVDCDGSAYVTGSTWSTDFPTTDGAYDTSIGIGDLFVTKFDSTGSTLIYSTFLGGILWERGAGIAVDNLGNAFIAGGTGSVDFPTTPGVFDETYNGSADAFVTKLNPTGSVLVYSTLIGGGDWDNCHGMVIDGEGNAYIAGNTRSSDFPVTSGAYDETFNGGMQFQQDVFVTKLNSYGSDLVYSTFLGGFMLGPEWCYDISIDGNGSAYVTGYTRSLDFPTTAGAFKETGDMNYIFITKFTPSGDALDYSTYLGRGCGYGIAVDYSGNAYVAGVASDSLFPVTPGAYDVSYNGDYGDAFITKFNQVGSGIIYSTFIGGTGYESSEDITLDNSGSAYIIGWTRSLDFPYTSGAIDTSYSGGPYGDDAFLTKLNPEGTDLDYSTYFGGASTEVGISLFLDLMGKTYITGIAGIIPTTPGAFSETPSGGFGNDIFVSKLNLGGNPPIYPSVSLFHPNGGEILSDTAVIIWAATDPNSGETELLQVDLDYSDNAGTSWASIDSNQTNTGSYLWDISSLKSGLNYMVRITVTDTFGLSDCDSSDGVFIIEDPTATKKVQVVLYSPTPSSGICGAMCPEEPGRTISQWDHVKVPFKFKVSGDGDINGWQVKFTGEHANSLSMIAKAGVLIFDENDENWYTETDDWISLQSFCQSEELDEVGCRILSGNLWIYIESADRWSFLTTVFPKFPELTIQLKSPSPDEIITSSVIRIALEEINFFSKGICNQCDNDDEEIEYMVLKADCIHTLSLEVNRWAEYFASSSANHQNPLFDPENQSHNHDPDYSYIVAKNIFENIRDRFGTAIWHSLYARWTDIWLVRLDNHHIADIEFFGDCRHFTDLTISLLRCLGIPARFLIILGGGKCVGHVFAEGCIGDSSEGLGSSETGFRWRNIDATPMYHVYDNFGSMGQYKYPLCFLTHPYWNASCSRGCYYKAGWGAWASKIPYPGSHENDAFWRCCPEHCSPAYGSFSSCDDCHDYQEDLSECEGRLDDPALKLNCINCFTDVREHVWPGIAPGKTVVLGGDLDLIGNNGNIDNLHVDIIAPSCIDSGTSFNAEVLVHNTGQDTVCGVLISIYDRPYSSVPESLYIITNNFQVIDTITPNEIDTVLFDITPIHTAKFADLTLSYGDTLGIDTGIMNCALNIDSPGSLPDLIVEPISTEWLSSTDTTINIKAKVKNNELENVADATVEVEFLCLSDSTYLPNLPLTYSPIDSIYSAELTIEETVSLGAYELYFFAEKSGFESDTVTNALYITSGNLQISNWSVQKTVFAPDTFAISCKVVDRDSMVTDAKVDTDVLTPYGTFAVPHAVNSLGYYNAFICPADIAFLLDSLGVPAGGWEFLTRAQYYGSNTEVFAGGGPPIYPLACLAADLQITGSDISFLPADGCITNSVILISAEINNLGEFLCASDLASVRLMADATDSTGIIIATKILPSIEPDSSYTVIASWDSVYEDHEIFVIVDNYNDVPESDETNNVASKFLNICSPPESVDDLSVALSGSDICLWWTEPYSDIGVNHYVVYRSFVVDSLGDSLAYTTDTTFIDPGTTGDSVTNYFYAVKAVDIVGKKSLASNKVGEFDRDLSAVRLGKTDQIRRRGIKLLPDELMKKINHRSLNQTKRQ